MSSRPPLFPLGTVISTVKAMEAFVRSGDDPISLLSRHAQGDWGNVCMPDWRANDGALSIGARVFSSYRMTDGTRLLVVTEADRSVTCMLLPEEF